MHVSATRTLAFAATLLLCAFSASANDKPYKQFGATKVYFSAFNSSFIRPEIASLHNIVRGKDKGLVNISVIVDDLPSGKAAQVNGSVANMLAQQQVLDFVEIREGDSVYYLAPFSFDNEDPLTFKVQVKNATDNSVHDLTFKRTFYHDK